MKVRARRMLRFGIPLIVYALFCVWYTDWRGPLRPAEIENFMREFVAAQPAATVQQQKSLRQFMQNDSGRQFIMVNNLELAKHPPAMPGFPANAGAEQLLAHYMEHMYAQLLRRACHPVIAGPAVHNAMDITGIEGAEHWTQGALMRYKSRRAFMEIVTQRATHERHAYKLAALTKTIAYPIEADLYLGDLRLLLGLLALAAAALPGLFA